MDPKAPSVQQKGQQQFNQIAYQNQRRHLPRRSWKNHSQILRCLHSRKC